MIIEPLLTLAERDELDQLEQEEILLKAILPVIGEQVMERIARGPGFQVIGDRVQLKSGREYFVRPDGNLQRVEPKPRRRK